MMRRGTTLIELLVAASLVLVLSMSGFGLLRWARITGETGLTAHVGLQMATRRAIGELVRDLEESIEVVSPPPGATLPYALLRDKRNHLLLLYAAESPAGSGRFELRMFRRDTSAAGAETGDRPLIRQIERATFTSLGAGLLQIHLILKEQGRSYPLLTAVRCRNGAAELVP